MKYIVALASLAATAMAGGVTSAISPSSAPPSGCQMTAPGSYAVTTVNATTSTKRDLLKRATGLIVTINGGVMKDSEGNTAYIASNDQFQFDNPPQAGAIYTAGWSLCPNGTIALGGSTIFYSCASGQFSNLYDVSQGGQCSQVFISAMGAGSSETTPASSAVSQTSDHQPQAPTSAAVSQISDHQPQAPTTAGVSQISDHQPQAPTSVANYTAPMVTPYTAGAAINHPEVLALAAGAVALLF